MALTTHQRKHVLALLLDVADLPYAADRARIRLIANDLLEGRTDWPAHLVKPCMIHDWAEPQDDE